MDKIKLDYWCEVISEGASNCDLKLTKEQLECLADAAEQGHDCYGMAFYSPPSGDRYYQIESEWKAKYTALEREFEKYRGNAETAVKTACNLHRDDRVSIEDGGEVMVYSGRPERVL